MQSSVMQRHHVGKTGSAGNAGMVGNKTGIVVNANRRSGQRESALAPEPVEG
jgi:hypothetical protein